MKTNTQKLILLLFVFLIFLNACKEDAVKFEEEPILPIEVVDDSEETKEKFFDKNFVSQNHPRILPAQTSRENTPPALGNILDTALEELLEQEEVISYISTLVNEIGYPIWDRGKIVYENEEQTQVIIPFAFLENGYTSSFLLITDHSEGAYEYFVVHKSVILGIADQPDRFEGARKYLAFLLMFYLEDKELFGTEEEGWLEVAHQYRTDIFRPNPDDDQRGRNCFEGWTTVTVCGWMPIYAFTLEYGCIDFNAPTYSDCFSTELQPISQIGGGLGGGGGGGTAPNPYVDCPQAGGSTGGNDSGLGGYGTEHPSPIGSLYDGGKTGKEFNIDLDALFLIPGLPGCGSDFTISERECLLENEEILDEVTSILNDGKFMDVCGNTTPSDMIKDALGGICGNENLTTDDFYEELGANFDYIILHESTEDCEVFNCLMNLIESGTDNNSLFCSTIGNFLDTPEFDLEFKFAPNGNGIYYGADGQTSPPVGNKITITLNETFHCREDSHPLSLANTILHEAIHAEMFRLCLDAGVLFSEPLSYEDIFNTSLVLTGDYTVGQHEIMARDFVDALAEALYYLNEEQYTIEHYKYLAWGGLSQYGSLLGLVSEYASEYYGLHQELMNTDTELCD